MAENVPIGYMSFPCTDNLLNYFVYHEEYELDPKQVEQVGEPIASGHYGDVYVGRLLESNNVETIAIKTTKRSDNSSPETLKTQRDAIRAEIKILAYVGRHENVIQLKGAVTTNPFKFCMVTEYCAHKGLDTFLKARKEMFIDQIRMQGSKGICTYYTNLDETQLGRNRMEISTSDLFSFALQICNGMDFLHSKQVIHRDLALRNILLTGDLVVKIADFGLSRQLEDGAYQQDTRPALPFRWSAPEVLYGNKRIPIEADLWTFGILLWELFKLCAVPYEGKSVSEVIAFLNAGKRLDQPEYAPEEIYQLMKELWQLVPGLRPPLMHCKKEILKQLQNSSVRVNC